MAPRPTIFTLSRKRRRMYFGLLIVVFVITVPLLFLYATGYRFESVAGLTETGGIYVGADLSGAGIYINKELVHETGTFRHAFFVQDLKPGTYTITVSKDGQYPWGKTLAVYAHIVTEAQAFNMPQKPVLELIPSSFTNQTSSGTNAPAFPNPAYEDIAASFRATTTNMLSTSGNIGSGTTKAFLGMQLSDTGTRIAARWTHTAESAPFYFCIREGECVDEIVLNTKGEKPTYFDFFPGSTDLAVVTLKDGVYVTELDNRSGQNIQPLFLAPHADFRIIDGAVYVKTGDTIYKVEL